MDQKASRSCTDNPALSPGLPAANFDTASGAGTGKLDGVAGATVTWTLADGGEPGTGKDLLALIIKDKDGNTVLSFGPTALKSGEEQASGTALPTT